jgi:hypothetical protein
VNAVALATDDVNRAVNKPVKAILFFNTIFLVV